ncbi:hypothetical protein GALL_332620 [mine drainage metagenome]|uniref:Uncharacterized protein n=1 Tax=mine drainage metagenome TaxID=410659 RepID=A0A1J5QMY2_9ZZZZ
MKKQTLNKLVIAAFITSLSFVATSAIAAQDMFQQEINQRLMKSRQQLNEIKASKDATERQKLLSAHMKTMQETMEKCRAMKPKVGMSEKERDDWFNEHQKTMDDMMGQMMEEHRMMMDMGNMPMDMDGMHKH